MKIFVIFNPASHKAKKKNDEFLKALDLLGERNDLVLLETSKPGDGKALTERAVREGADIVVAAGGDGTLHEVVNGAAGTEAVVAVLPLGITNVFALDAKIPINIIEAARLILEGKPRAVDLGKADGEYFILMLGAGLDAYAVHKLNLKAKKALGRGSYILSGFTNYLSYKPSEIRVLLKDLDLDLQGYHVIIANTASYGGRFKISPEARWDDGLLDICVFQKRGPYNDFRYFLGVLNSRHSKYPDVVIVKSSDIHLEGDGVYYHLDSEPVGILPIHVKAVHGAVKIILPDLQSDL